MQLFTITISSIKKLSKSIPVFAIFFLIAFTSNAQIRKYGLVYSDNIKGGSTIFGNTLMNIITGGKIDTAEMNDNRIDGNTPNSSGLST